MKYCWNCGKVIPQHDVYCNEACKQAYFLWLTNRSARR